MKKDGGKCNKERTHNISLCTLLLSSVMQRVLTSLQHLLALWCLAHPCPIAVVSVSVS